MGFVLFVALLAGTHGFAADTLVGSIQSRSGDVQIDAFGKGVFVDAEKGDALYASSVVKTGTGGLATIALQGAVREVGSGATVRIADLLAATAKKSRLGWFGAMGKLLQSIISSGTRGESELTLGGRAKDVSEENDPSTDWMVEETDAAALLTDARKRIEDGSYATALAVLQKADPPSDPAVGWDLSFWTGVCYYQLEDYADAAASFAAARALEQTPAAQRAASDGRGTLLYLWGSSLFLVGREREAVAPLDACVAGYADGPWARYATLLLAKSLAAAGDAVRARATAVDGATRYKGTDVEADFAALLK